jgi:CheY-like chemotaxis protein
MFKILIIDDDGTFLQLYRYLFEEEKYEVKTASSGVEAIKVLDIFVPDFMIVDISMPEMDGWQFITEINRTALRRPEIKNIPYIVITGENFVKENKDFHFEQDKNFNGYFVKMTSTDEVVKTVNDILNGKKTIE